MRTLLISFSGGISEEGHREARNSKMTEDRWFSLDEIAAYLGVKRDTLYKWVQRQNLPAHKVGRLLKFQVGEVDQ